MCHMSYLGTRHKFTLLWPHSSLCPTILPSFCHPREPIKVLKEGGQTGFLTGPGQGGS